MSEIAQLRTSYRHALRATIEAEDSYWMARRSGTSFERRIETRKRLDDANKVCLRLYRELKNVEAHA